MTDEQKLAQDSQTGAPVSPPPIADRVFETSTLDEMEETGNRLVSPHWISPRARGRHAEAGFQFHGSKNLFALDVHYGRDLIVHHPDQPDDRIAFVMALGGSSRFVDGKEEVDISSRQGVLFATSRNTLHFAEDSHVAAFMVDRRRLAQYCAHLRGRDIEGEVEFQRPVDLDDQRGRSWLRLVEYATTELTDPDSLVRSFATAHQQLEQMVLTGLLLSQRHQYTDDLMQPQAAAAPYYVKRAEAYIEHHFADPLSLAEIAAVAGVSARSLQNGFRNFRNMTPMAFLRSVRLQNAHLLLAACDPNTATTTQIALRAGFSHMGEFAALYKKAYGVSPSQTLLKSP